MEGQIDMDLLELNSITDNVDMSIVNFCLFNLEESNSQLRVLKETLVEKKVIWVVETGLGKTYLTAGLLNSHLPWLMENKKKALVIAPTNKIVDFYNLISSTTIAKVIRSTGAAYEVEDTIKQWKDIEVLVTTPSAWSMSLEFNCFMFNNASDIGIIIYDEATSVDDNGFSHVMEIAKRHASVVAMLNATPLPSVSSFSQSSKNTLKVLYNLLYAIGSVNTTYSSFYHSYTYETKVNDARGVPIREIDVKKIKGDFGRKMINFNREEINAGIRFSHCKFHRCEVTNAQRKALQEDNSKTYNILYSPATGNSLGLNTTNVAAITELFRTLISLPADSHKIIFVRYQQTIQVLQQALEFVLGYKVFILDGKRTNTPELKHDIETLYNNYDGGCIMITNITRGSNLGTAENMIIYDTPPDICQYIARSVRGFVSKEITLDWIYYPTYDEDTMVASLRSVIAASELTDRSLDIIQHLGIELQEVYKTNNQLNAMLTQINL